MVLVAEQRSALRFIRSFPMLHSSLAAEQRSALRLNKN
jgi:hypothetical protein